MWRLNFDFDVAIIGAGSYGLPLGRHIKRSGKQAIHRAGNTQLMFGIRGRRWEELSPYKALIDNSWVRPAESETPKGSDGVERGAYW